MSIPHAEDAHARLLEERQRLDAVRDALVDRVAGLPVSLRNAELSATDQHPADAGTEMFERAKDLSILEQVDAELSAVERALQRVEDGGYGMCEACGGPIGRARLEARPAATLCIDDQSRTERMSRSDRVRS